MKRCATYTTPSNSDKVSIEELRNRTGNLDKTNVKEVDDEETPDSEKINKHDDSREAKYTREPQHAEMILGIPRYGGIRP